VRERERERRQHDRPGEGEAEREPERAARGVDAGRLAHALGRNRGERVVVELRDEQAEAGPGNEQRDEEPPPRIGARHDRDQQRNADRGEREADADDRAGATASRAPPRDERNGEHAQRERRDREPGAHRRVLEHHLQIDRQGDHQSAERDLLQHLPGDPQAEDRRLEQLGVDQRRLPLALAAQEPPREGPEPDDADREQRRHGLAAFLPDEDAEHDAAHPQHGQDRADDVHLPGARVRRVLHELDPTSTIAITASSSRKAMRQER
jgi:hypothetical protein